MNSFLSIVYYSITGRSTSMDHPWILPVPEYYHRLNAYVLEAGLPRLKEAWNWRVILPRKKAHQ